MTAIAVIVAVYHQLFCRSNMIAIAVGSFYCRYRLNFVAIAVVVNGAVVAVASRLHRSNCVANRYYSIDRWSMIAISTDYFTEFLWSLLEVTVSHANVLRHNT